MILTGPSTDLRPLHPGVGSGELVVLTAPLSFWGGVDRRTGAIIDVHHPQHGAGLAGRVLAMRAGRGSSSGSSVLAEVLRNGNGPAAVLLAEPDLILSLGVIVAAETYGLYCPVAVLSASVFAQLRTGDWAQLCAEAGTSAITAGAGNLQIWPAGEPGQTQPIDAHTTSAEGERFTARTLPSEIEEIA
ncbi:aconitase X swivel domain-containing protein [Nakamurella sp. PAMC28650]|uniref:aconitase X swivel domain-containing protein n=1 Tax=Nakamurella sp. PAMC28650 TaxID=2762325 RepID=UPI00164EB6F1|nr:DUF126 domain-containing protein [Nakamurella sp. PAMC28650]QNK81557.1 DUF126 domain-containing protein [Nakamurella sp. PAMC28650]